MESNSHIPPTPLAEMPMEVQEFAIWLFGAIAAVVLLYGFRMAYKTRSLLPVYLMVGAAAASFLEPIIGYLGHLIHPPVGATVVFSAVDRILPLHMLFAYVIAFGVTYLIFLPKLEGGSVSTRYVWAYSLASVAIYILCEIYPVVSGLWVYYEPQPLWPFAFLAPFTWPFLNTTAALVGITLIALLLPNLKGTTKLVVIPLAPIGAVMGHLGSGWPMFLVMNSPISGSGVLLQLSGIAAVLCCFTVIWICSVVLSRQHWPESAHSAKG